MQVGMQVAPTPSFFENENAGRAFMYLSYWLAGLYVVSEGWQELKLSDPEVDALLKSPHLEKLKRFRHGVCHLSNQSITHVTWCPPRTYSWSAGRRGVEIGLSAILI